MTREPHLLSRPAARNQRIEPRGLRRPDAAAYVGFGVTKFDEMVADGRMPKPIEVDGRKIWDRWRLDAALDALSDQDNGGWRFEP